MSEGPTSGSDANSLRDAAMLQALVTGMPGGLVHVSAQGKILHANAKAAEVLGLSYEALTERYTTDFETVTVWEDGTRCADKDYPVTRALITGEIQAPVTIGIQRSTEEVTWAIFTAVPVKSEAGEVESVMVLFMDITERKRMQKERADQESMRRKAAFGEALGRLSGGIAHDINNLMTVVMGHADALGKAASGDGSVREILHAAERAAELTQQLLAFGRCQVMQLASVDIDGLIRGLTDELKQLLPSGATLTLACDAAGNHAIGDAEQLKSVLTVLVDNAAFAIDGDGTVEIRTARSGDHVVFEVSDDGCGMTDAVLERALDPFFTTRDGRQGRGLGLSTAQGIVAQSGGTMALSSKLGAGTQVQVRLRRVSRQQSTPVLKAIPRALAGGPDGRPPVVLLAEDEHEVRALFARALTLGGYRVLDVADGTAALAVAQTTPVDVLVTDILMPGMTGVELARTLRKVSPSLPVVFVTGYAESPTLEDMYDTRTLQKPFSPDRLLAALNEVVSPRTETSSARTDGH